MVYTGSGKARSHTSNSAVTQRIAAARSCYCLQAGGAKGGGRVPGAHSGSTWQKLELRRGQSHCQRRFREQREGRRNTLGSPYQREGLGKDLNSRQTLGQHPGLEEVDIRLVTLRETVIPASTLALSQSTSLSLQSKGVWRLFLLPAGLV